MGSMANGRLKAGCRGRIKDRGRGVLARGWGGTGQAVIPFQELRMLVCRGPKATSGMSIIASPVGRPGWSDATG